MTKRTSYKDIQDNLEDSEIYTKEVRDALVKFGVDWYETNRKGMEALANFFVENLKNDNEDLVNKSIDWKLHDVKRSEKQENSVNNE